MMKLTITISVLILISNLIVAKTIIERNDQIYINTIEFENDFLSEYKMYMQTGTASERLKHFLDVLMHGNNTNVHLVDIPKATDPILCLTCRASTNLVINLYRETRNASLAEAVAFQFCNTTTHVNERLCHGFVDLNAPIIKFIMDENSKMNSESVCNIAFQMAGCATHYNYPEFKIKSNHHRRTPALPQQQVPSHELIHNRKNYTIVQITDVHYDLFYKPGGNAVCKMGACCRANQGSPSKPEYAAGRWGDYRDCDSPWEAVVDIVRQIKSQYSDIDFIYFTGDIVDHFTWETTKENNLYEIRKFFKLLRDEFVGIPVFPIIGNHEAHPGNCYPPPKFTGPEALSIQWLYDEIAEEWQTWLPRDTQSTIKTEGFYTVLVKPGFRLIGINNNVCYGHNWWLLYNTTVYVQQLQWLHDTLQQAALQNEFVHIIGHVPSNDELCFAGWTREYRKIIEKFSYVITAQFNGHSHNDEFVLFYDKKNTSNLVNVAWNGASGTPFTYLNPNYRVYHVHPFTYEVLDFDTWIYNLTEANLNPDQSPRWFKEYSFKEAYGLSDLSLNSLNSLLNRFAHDKNVLKQFWQFKVKMADPQLAEGCNDACLAKTLCDIVRVEYNDTAKCDELLQIFYTEHRHRRDQSINEI